MSKYTLVNVTGPDLDALATRLRLNLPAKAYVNANERRGTVFCRMGKHKKDAVLDVLEDISYGVETTWDTAVIDHHENTGDTHTVSVYNHGGDFRSRDEFELVMEHGKIWDNIHGERTERVMKEVHGLNIRPGM